MYGRILCPNDKLGASLGAKKSEIRVVSGKKALILHVETNQL